LEKMHRSIFFVSDGTGITAETIGHTLMTQFPGVDLNQTRLPFVDSLEKAQEARKYIEAAGIEDGVPPIVINTLVDQALTDIICQAPALVLDIFDQFIGDLEKELGLHRQLRMGQTHGLTDYQAYEQRMDATNYALTHDDGVAASYENADVVLVGVSRSGKTPTCLYMGLQYGIKAGNYPLTEEDLGSHKLPPRLVACKHKLFGLTIDPERLVQIREARRPGSRYANLRVCKSEVADAEAMFRMHRIPNLNTTHTSIEEISGKILIELELERYLF
jgi:regulator of PEP synthase PpsR (kinase-PPPase family)